MNLTTNDANVTCTGSQTALALIETACAHMHALSLAQSLVTALVCDKPALKAHQRNMSTACPVIQMITGLRHHA